MSQNPCVWVDADACPKVVREILLRAAQRTGIQLTFVANQAVPVPPAPNIKAVQVPSGFDIADNEIVRRVSVGDLVITGASGVQSGGPPPLGQRERQQFANALDRYLAKAGSD